MKRIIRNLALVCAALLTLASCHQEKTRKALLPNITGTAGEVIVVIGQIFPSTWDWYTFLNILALLSIMLGVMNLLPIPALDGGHMLFTIYEMITGRKPSDKFLYVTQIIGMILVFGLMFLAFGNDIGRLLR